MVEFVKAWAFELFFGGFASMVICCFVMIESTQLRAGRRLRDIGDDRRAIIQQAREDYAALIASLEDSDAPANRRAGISLTEVLLAMFVLTVGILGLAALLPVGSSDLRTAQTLDRSSNLGRAAFHDVQVRGYLDPKRWMTSIGTGTDYTTGTPAWTHPRLPVDMMTPVERCTPFVIDPLLIGAHAGDAAKLARISAFPVELDNDPPNGFGLQIPRIVRGTLRAWPSDAPTVNNPPAMSLSIADRIFRASDDLTFGLPENEPDGRPFAALGSARQVRKFTGDYSYMITVVPVRNVADARVYEEGTTNITPVREGERTYTVSIVVFQKRVLDVPELDAADRGELPPTERLVYLDFINGITATGGDVQLRLPGGTLADFEAIRPGRWIMLASIGWQPFVPPPPGAPEYIDEEAPSQFRWHRITSAGEPRIEDGEVIQDVRLFGADWSAKDAVDTSTGTPAFHFSNRDADGDINVMTIHAIIPDGVVNVYEKTMRLDTRSFGVRCVRRAGMLRRWRTMPFREIVSRLALRRWQ